MTTIAQTIATAAEFAGTDWDQLIDAPLIAAHIFGEIGGINCYTYFKNDSIAALTRVDGETMTFDIEVDVEEGKEMDTLIVAGWSWATTDTDGQTTGEGGGPLDNADDLDMMISEIADWAYNA